MVSVADFLQTDDLYQLAQPRELPELPDFTKLSLLTCGHAALAEDVCESRRGRWSWCLRRPALSCPFPGRQPACRFGPPAAGRPRRRPGRRRRNAATSISRRGTAGSSPARRSGGPTDDHKPVRSGA